MIQFQRLSSSSFDIRHDPARGIVVSTCREVQVTVPVWEIDTGFVLEMDHRTGLLVALDRALLDRWMLLGPSPVSRGGEVRFSLRHYDDRTLLLERIPPHVPLLVLTPTRLVSGLETDIQILDGADDFGGSVTKQVVIPT
jgi:hypothetical protein